MDQKPWSPISLLLRRTLRLLKLYCTTNSGSNLVLQQLYSTKSCQVMQGFFYAPVFV
jgi:hypothetical protein